jgi:predicted MFS family arabinose efflux permease
LHLVLGLPLNAWLPRAALHAPPAAPSEPTAAQGPAPQSQTSKSTALRIAVPLAILFAVTGFISTAMAAHLPRLLDASGASLAAAVAVAALIGPAQVGGRLLEFGVLRRVHPVWSARLAALMHPVGAVALLVFAAPVAAVFAVLHGAGNGILTITKGTLPLAYFGPDGYGQRQGLLMIPSRAAQALAPWVFGVCIDHWGTGALWITAALGMMAVMALALLPRAHALAAVADPPSSGGPT